MYDKVIGSLLVFSWINSMLYMLEITQVISYYTAFKGDTMLLKVTVGTCFLLDTVCTFANNLGVYQYTITHWGDVAYLSQQEWEIPLYLICTGLCAAVVQVFLIKRYYTLSKQKLLIFPLLFLMIASLAGAIATAVMIILASSITNRATLTIPVIIWFVVSCVIDCGLAALLIFHLRSSRTGFRTTRSLVNRLSSVALQSGTYTSAMALTILFLFLADPESNVATGVGQCLGRVYTLTLLHNLLIRQSIRSENRAGTHTTGQIESVQLNGIRVRTDRTVLVHMDDTPKQQTDKSMVDVKSAASMGAASGDDDSPTSKGYAIA